MNQIRSMADRVSVARTIGANAARLSGALDDHMRDSFSPDARKTLRTFSPSEAAEMIGASPSNIRRLHQDGTIPDVGTDARGRRVYTAAEIDAMREILADTVRGGETYRVRRRPGEKLQILTISNLKGGSGKSNLSIMLAHRMALRGYRVLCVDLDPQASLTGMFGYRPEVDFADGGTIYEALRYDEHQTPLSRIVRPTYFHNLDLAPAGLMLSEYETDTAYALMHKGHIPFYRRLSVALEDVEDRFDIVILDCPPSLGFLTLTAMMASTGLIVPVIPNMLDIASMAQFMRLASQLVEEIEGHAGKVEWDFMSFLISRYEPSDVPQTQMAAFLRSVLRGQVLNTPLLKSTAISDAGMTQQTIYEVDPSLFVRRTLDRILESANAVAAEIERSIWDAWGREVAP